MVFGEIVEPSSRALWEDDFIEYPEDEGLNLDLQWNNNLKVPEVLKNLYVGDTARILTLLQKCVLQRRKPLCEIVKAGIALYKIENDSYVVTYKAQPDAIVGKITEKLIPWLRAATDIYVFTSAPITSLLNCAVPETSPCVIRSLSSKNSQSSISRLEVPNLATGLSASVLSYCIHKELTCTLYVGFLEEVPLDSLNTRPLVDLFRQLRMSPLQGYVLEKKAPSNNLYM